MNTDASERSSTNEQALPGKGSAGHAATPTSVEEALARARQHGQAALAETLATLGALLDAASLAATGTAGDSGRMAPFARTLEQLRGWLDPSGSRDAAALLESFLAALDAEIGRWEKRSGQDPEARAVLRAFLAVRELLWEAGARPAEQRSTQQPPRAARPGPARVRGPRRARRVPVEG